MKFISKNSSFLTNYVYLFILHAKNIINYVSTQHFKKVKLIYKYFGQMFHKFGQKT